MSSIDIDLMSEEDFRRSIESRLRQGLAGKAAEKLRTLLAPFAGPDKILPGRFLTVTPADLSLGGWDALHDNLKRHDRPGRPVTALSIAFGWPGEDVPQPDEQGHLSPLIEVGYYTDDAFPFSQSSREDLLEGYSYHGCTWTGDCEAIDNALWLSGIDDLHGALAILEAQLLASEEPDEEGIRAGSLGACLLSVLLFQAVDARIQQSGLPRPLCVMSGSNGVYPYFDAPVAGFPEDARKAAEVAEEEGTRIDAGVPVPRYSSLLVTGIPRAQKRAVLVLEETADEEAMRIARLRGIAHGEIASAQAPLPSEPPLRSDGSIASAPPPRQPDEVIAEVPASPLMVKKPSGQNWDFREFLSPQDSEDESDEALDAAGFEPDPEWDDEEPAVPEQDWGGGAPFEPEAEPLRAEAPPAASEPDWTGGAPSWPGEDPQWDDAPPAVPELDRDAAAPLELETQAEPAPEPELEPEAAALDLAEPDEPEPEAAPSLFAANERPVAPGFSLLDALREDRAESLFPLPVFNAAAAPKPEAEPELEPISFAPPEPAPELDLADLDPPEADEPLELGDFVVEEDFAEPELEPEAQLASSVPEEELASATPAALPAWDEPAVPAWQLGRDWLEQAEARILPSKTLSRPPVYTPPREEEPVRKRGIWGALRAWWYGQR